MPPIKKSRSSHSTESKPKLFQCKGFGDCHMVFTRSEHLARHTRKHTGEKPYQCVVPGCTRMFSRFDNMMQHTQTHRPTHQRKQQQDQQTYQGGLMSPVSLGSPEQPHWEDDESDEDVPKQRRLSVADLCNPIHLTLDEFEALEGFARFRETPLFYESLRDLANVACIEPRPSQCT
ncbi:hypothetical protein BJV82DRAFT_586178 [Fennellomyces sp. T-0311]|nr:hypothetical protein BJV82DRAFT_586178 [Fennellomyces sp. T-0311]